MSAPNAVDIDTNADNQTIEQMEARISLLSDEIDANEDENRMMQQEIDDLYARIDARKQVQSGLFTIVVRSTEGRDTEHSAESVQAALKIAKINRTQANRMVKILDARYVTHRWDRTNVVGENRWRKVDPGAIEILGNPAPITVTRAARLPN
jgi:hypothetical protein